MQPTWSCSHTNINPHSLHALPYFHWFSAHFCVCVCVTRELGRTVEIVPLQGVEFLGQSAQNLLHFIWDFLWYIHTFLSHCNRSLCDAAYCNIKVWMEDLPLTSNYGVVASWQPCEEEEGSSTALPRTSTVNFILLRSCVFNVSPTLDVLLGQHIAPCFTCQYRKSWLTFFAEYLC